MRGTAFANLIALVVDIVVAQARAHAVGGTAAHGKELAELGQGERHRLEVGQRSGSSVEELPELADLVGLELGGHGALSVIADAGGRNDPVGLGIRSEPGGPAARASSRTGAPSALAVSMLCVAQPPIRGAGGGSAAEDPVVGKPSDDKAASSLSMNASSPPPWATS